MERETLEFDVVVVGAGPSGLSCAIRLAQLAKAAGKTIGSDFKICVLEKGAEVGAHLLSGAVFETRALDELLPDWKALGAPIKTSTTRDRFVFLTKRNAFALPVPPHMHNKGNYIISLGELGRWLAAQAEALGVEIITGFAATDILYDDDGHVVGVATGDMGRLKDGSKGDQFTLGVDLRAGQTVFAEGCHGSLTKRLIARYNLRKFSDPQTYGLGIKEVWEIPADQHTLGLVQHTIGWPMDSKTYGGSWLYMGENNTVSIGYVVGLDYKNPTLSPFEEMQRFKTHPAISKILKGGRRISYGAKALVEGGWQSLPRLTFAGGLLIGDTAGFLNVPKIKGNHTAMKSGMIAAEALFPMLAKQGNGQADTTNNECTEYPKMIKASWLGRELYSVRNIRPAFQYGLWVGMLLAAIETYIFKGNVPWTFKNHADHKSLLPLDKVKPIAYPKPDGKLSFDKLSSVYLSGTNHREDQPCHLILTDADIPVRDNLAKYGEPAQKYCPAGVYEIVRENGKPRFQINAQNCVHCKTCDIKDPAQNITWTPPEGGGGPRYGSM